MIAQLQAKLQAKIDELQRETQDKLKFKKLYEESQDKVAALEAALEDGARAPPKKPIQPQGATRPRVERKAVLDTALELKFKLQSKGFYSS